MDLKLTVNDHYLFRAWKPSTELGTCAMLKLNVYFMLLLNLLNDSIHIFLNGA